MAKRAYKYIAILLIYTAASIGAQAESSFASFFQGWQLYYSEGDITITQNGVRTAYRAGTEKPREILLIPQDMIQTGKGTAEIQLITGTLAANQPADKPLLPEKTYTVIKMGENTSLLVDRQENREITLELLYGRARVITGTAEPGIALRTGASVTTLRNCDTAIDYIIKPGITQPILTLHCIYGQGEVIPRYAPGTEPTKFSLKEEETFSLEYRIPYSYMERRSLDSQILAYWQANPFTSGAPLPMPQGVSISPQGITGLANTPAAGQAGENDLAQTDNPLQTSDSPKLKRARGINVFGLVAGLLLVSGGGALLTYSMSNHPDPGYRNKLFYSSFAPIGLGALFITGSIVNPTE